MNKGCVVKTYLMLPWFQYTTIPLGPLNIQIWGLFVALGMVVSVILIKKRAKFFGLKAQTMLDMAIWVLIGGFVGARVFHVFLYEPSFYLYNPIEILAIWHGGLSSFGGFFGAIAAAVLFCKKKDIPKKDWLPIADLLSWSALYGWIIGRIGCFMIHDHLGKPCNCVLAIAGPDQPRLEMALVEIIALLPLAILFFMVRKKHMPKGWFFSIILMYYGVVRFILDFFRAIDLPSSDARLLGLTPAQYFSIVAFGFGVYIFFKKNKLRKFYGEVA